MTVTLLGTGGSAGVPMIGGADGSGDWGDCDPAEPRNRRTRRQHRDRKSDKQTASGRYRRLICATSCWTARFRGVDAMLFTHAHADHITGLDDVRILNRIADRPLDGFATGETLAEMTERFGYAFRPWDPPVLLSPCS